MINQVPQNLDLAIAGSLIIFAVVLFLLNKMSLLSRKSLPYIIVGITGSFSALFLRNWLLNKQITDFKSRDAELKKKEKKLEQYKKSSDQTELDLRSALQKLEAEREAYNRQIVENREKTQEARKAVSLLTRDELSERAAAILYP